jgi:YD repeat-containing protein
VTIRVVAHRNDGGWACRGSTQTYCTGGTQLYGWVADTGSQAIPTTYDTVNGHYIYGYDEFNRLTSANINSGQSAYSFTYDRWGNRTAQTLTAGTSGWHWTGSFNNLTNQAVGYSYDIAGNLLNDGSHSYTYDAEGNVLTVDGGSTATYVYDAMNRRISAQTASGTNEFVYDPAGHRMSTWNTVTNSGTDGRIYWGNQQIAYRSGDGTTYLDHQDWQGTERNVCAPTTRATSQPPTPTSSSATAPPRQLPAPA